MRIKNITEYTKYDGVLSLEDSNKLRKICIILAIICNIPCFISIFVFIFQYSKLKLGQKIQLILCISIVLYEGSHYLPVSSKYQWLCYFQCIISYGIQVIISYLAMIYSYIALIMFTRPNDIKSKYNIFFIYFSTPILYFVIIIYILFIPDLSIFFGFTVYPEDNISRLLNYFLVFIFLLANIINNIILVNKIKNFIGNLPKIDNFAKDKLFLFKKKLIFNILGIIFVFHYSLPVGFLTSFGLVEGDVFFSLGYFVYLYANKAILGIVFWFIFIFSKNFWHKFLVLIRIENNKKFEEDFIKEDIILEYNPDDSNIINNSKNNETININMEELENLPSINNSEFFHSSYEDDNL